MATLGGLHEAEDVHPGFLFWASHLHDFLGDALDLDVHLQRRDAGGGAGDLEVHVAEVISSPRMSVSTGEAVAVLIRPMAIPAT